MTEDPATGRTPGALRRAVLLGLFAGTGVGVGYLLVGVPNCELITLISALAGGVLGRRLGFASGALAAAIFSLGNPIGKPPPVLLLGQTLGMGAAGWLGGAAAGAVAGRWRAGRRLGAALLSLGTGLLATLFYDLLTNVAGAVAFAVDARTALVAGLPFALLHMMVNGAQFFFFFPALVARYRHLASPPLRGAERLVPLALLIALGLSLPGGAAAQPDAPAALPTAAAAPDSGALATARPDSGTVAETAAEPDSAGARPSGPGERPFWSPFSANLVESLTRDTFWTVTADGGFGAWLVVAHEATTEPAPLVVRDGVPLGTGHRWTDDLWLVGQTGLDVGAARYGLDAWGGTGGEIRLLAADGSPAVPVVDSRFSRGKHGTFLRSVAFRTPRAPWRLRFDFEETLDQQGYDFRVPGDSRWDFFDGVGSHPARGEARLRNGRATLERHLPDGRSLVLTVETVRKLKQSQPATGTDHEEVWADHAALTWRGRTSLGQLRASLFVSGADVQREWPRSGEAWRKLEMAREGVLLELTPARGGQRRLAATVLGWRLRDSGADPAWADIWGGPVNGAGEEASLSAGTETIWKGLRLAPELAGWWAAHGGWRPGGELAVRPAGGRPWWDLSLGLAGRAPRSDELLTADRVEAPDGTAYLLAPNHDLDRERTWRAALRLTGSLLGTDLAVEGSARALRDGIGWSPLADREGAGRWENSLALDSRTLTASAERRLRLAGRLRLRALAAWREQTLLAGVPLGLPPARAASLAVDWERYAFHDDGVFEIGYRLERRGAADDPWLPGLDAVVPARTLHHLLLGFRLVGADLSLAVRNLADDRTPVSAGALGDGRDLRWRLEWSFSH